MLTDKDYILLGSLEGGPGENESDDTEDDEEDEKEDDVEDDDEFKEGEE